MKNLAHLSFHNNKQMASAAVLSILAKSAASSLELFDLKKVDVVDPLQFFAEKTGLVELIGQDTVQQIISVPFVHHGARP